MSVRRHEQQTRTSDSGHGFWVFGFLSVGGQGWKGFWPCSGRFEAVVLFGMLSLVAPFVDWSRIVSGLNQEHA